MIGVLTSGVALGVHVPGLLLAQRMRERGAQVEIFVLERLLPDIQTGDDRPDEVRLPP